MAISMGSGRARIVALDDSIDRIRRKNFRTFRYAGVVGSPDPCAGNGSCDMADRERIRSICDRFRSTKIDTYEVK